MADKLSLDQQVLFAGSIALLAMLMVPRERARSRALLRQLSAYRIKGFRRIIVEASRRITPATRIEVQRALRSALDGDTRVATRSNKRIKGHRRGLVKSRRLQWAS
jgi:hypothetical protein